MRKLLSLFLAFSLLLCLTPAAYAVVEQSDVFYVADYASVLSASIEQQIIDANALLEAQCQGAQIVVVTTDYLAGMYSDEYARKLFYDWGVGSEAYNNGMLLLLGVQENKAWLEYGLGLSLDDQEVSMLLDMYFWDDFDRQDYDSAVSKLFSALLTWYDSVYGSHVASSGQALPAEQNNTRRQTMGPGTVLFLIVLIVVLVVIFGGSRRRRVYRSGWLTRRRTPPPPPPPPTIHRTAPPMRPGTPPRRPDAPPRPSVPSRPSSPPRSSRPSGGGMSRGGGGRPGGGAGRR